MSKISLTVAAVQAVLAALVLLGWISLTEEQLSGIILAVNSILFAVLGWFSPDVPVGRTEG